MSTSWFDRMTVQETLRHAITSDNIPETGPLTESRDTIISMLIHDIFGAEILKTHKKNGWYYYNRINGERVDLSGSDKVRSAEEIGFDDIPASPGEATAYFAREDYSAFMMKFIKAFEEIVGLGKYGQA